VDWFGTGGKAVDSSMDFLGVRSRTTYQRPSHPHEGNHRLFEDEDLRAPDLSPKRTPTSTVAKASHGGKKLSEGESDRQNADKNQRGPHIVPLPEFQYVYKTEMILQGLTDDYESGDGDTSVDIDVQTKATESCNHEANAITARPPVLTLPGPRDVYRTDRITQGRTGEYENRANSKKHRDAKAIRAKRRESALVTRIKDTAFHILGS